MVLFKFYWIKIISRFTAPLRALSLNFIIFFKNNFFFKVRRKLSVKKNFLSSKPVNRLIKSFVFFKSFYYLYVFSNTNVYTFKNIFKINFLQINYQIKKIVGQGGLAVRSVLFVFLVDSLIVDEEPIWEPIEWSLLQTWLLFIFIFSWIAENLITSRFGSYTGRDKRVWLAWYKSFWLIEMIYIISYGSASMFVIVPFYYELTYNLTFVFSWWNWYTKLFFFKFISTYSLILLLSNYLILNVKWLSWKKHILIIFIIFFFITFLLYSQFIITFFSYFTDPLWYQKTRYIDYIQLSHEPLKWGWGSAKRDHFTYHKVSTVFWFKNDGPFAAAFLMFNCFFFLCLFFLLLYWIILFRKTVSSCEISFTFSTYCVSSLKQFFFFFFFLYILIFISFIVCYWRFPIEFLFQKNSSNFFNHFLDVFLDYCLLR